MADQTGGTARFSVQVDHDNGAHVHFRLFAATGDAHLGLAGRLTMRADEFAAFTALLRDGDTQGAVTVISNTMPPQKAGNATPPVPEIGPLLPCDQPPTARIEAYRPAFGRSIGSLDWDVHTCAAHAEQHRKRVQNGVTVRPDQFGQAYRGISTSPGRKCGDSYDFRTASGVGWNRRAQQNGASRG